MPSDLNGKILQELHEGHQGVVKMKALAQSYVWWPNINRDVEQLAGACFECLQKRPDPLPVLHPWEWPEQPWKQVHIDMAPGVILKSLYSCCITRLALYIVRNCARTVRARITISSQLTSRSKKR